MKAKILLIFVSSLLIASCGGNKSKNQEPEPIPPIGFRASDYIHESTKVKSGETFPALMRRIGLSAEDAATMTSRLDTIFSPRKMKAGALVDMYFSGDSLQRKLEYAVYHNTKTRLTVFKCAVVKRLLAVRRKEEEPLRTLGLEILGDLPTADMVIVPAGGGGLLAGVAACIKQINPRVQVIGVQAEGASAIAQSFREKKYISTDSVSTIADGIAVKSPGDITVELINRYADDVVTVNDNEISEAILLLMERCKQIVEPSGATPVAAVLKGKVDVNGKKVVCLLSGGNIDVSFIQCIIAQGLVARNRRLRFTVTLLDKPGSLVKLLNDIAAQGANILTVEHDRLSAGLNPNQTNVHIACEVGGKEHGERLLRSLGDKGFIVSLNN